MPDRGAQALDQVRPAFGDDDADPGVALGRFEDVRLDRAGLSVLEPNAPLQPLQTLRRRAALHLREVRAADLEARVCQRVRELTVVGEEDGPFSVEVESAHWEHAALDGLQVFGDGGPPLRIVHGRDHADRLVEHVVDVAFGQLDELAVEGDQVRSRFDLRAQLGHGAVVHRDPTLGDELFGSATRGDPRARQILLQAFRHARPLTRSPPPGTARRRESLPVPHPSTGAAGQRVAPNPAGEQNFPASSDAKGGGVLSKHGTKTTTSACARR